MKTKKIPGPLVNTAIKGANDLRSSPLDYIQQMDKDYPGIANWQLLHLNIVHLSDPQLIRAVLQTNQKQYVKNTSYKQLKHILGNGLVTSEGDLWKRQRKLVQPSFHKQSIYNFFNVMLACANEMTEEWKEKIKTNEKIDFSQEMMAITLQIIGKTMLSTDVKAKAGTVGESLTYLLKAVEKRALKAVNLPLWLPTSSHTKFKKERAVLDKIIYSIIDERRRTKEKKHDLLDMLMESRYEDTGEAMPDDLLKDELMTIFLAGHETTASALTWTFYLISQHPEVYKKLKLEVDEIVGDGEITFDHFQKLKYTKACLNESMRLYPPIWMIGRRATEDNMVGEYLIKKNTDILISPYIVHHHPNYWKNPEKFDPERWETDEVKQMDKFTYFPFAAGPRMCIGNNFALFEADIIITKVIQHFSFEYLGAVPPPMDASITLRVKSKTGMPMKVTSLKKQ